MRVLTLPAHFISSSPPHPCARSSAFFFDSCRTYYSVISLGNVSLRVACDTASSDTWVVSSACNTAQCKNLPKYPLNYDSPTFVSVNQNQTGFNVSFVDTTSTLSMHLAFHSRSNSFSSCVGLCRRGGHAPRWSHCIRTGFRFVVYLLLTVASSHTSFPTGLMNYTNVSFVDQVSGILGLGFSRLSRIRGLVSGCTYTRRLFTTP